MTLYRGWTRNIHIQKHLLKRAAEMEPSMRCKATTVDEFNQWKAEFKAKLDELLGPVPQRVDPNPQIISRVEREHDFVEKFIIDVEHDLSAPGYICIPKDIKPGEKRPTILCPHGHGVGKGRPMGIDETPHRDRDEYGRILAEQGYVTAVIDSRGFGERQLGFPTGGGEMACNYLYLLYAMLGYELITLDVHDHMQAIDYLLTRDEVDGDRLGICGKSFGGTMSQYVGVCDERIKAACTVCYVTSTLDYTFEDINNNCGSQFVRGLFQYGDVATVAGLMAPRPLIVQSGFGDTCFEIGTCVGAHEELRSIYEAAGASDKLEIDVLDGYHEFNPKTAIEFFAKWIGPAR